MPLDRDLFDLLAFALMRKPGMIQIGTYQHQLHVFDGIDMVAYDPSRTLCIQDEIQFQLVMIMEGESKFFFDTGKNGEAVILSQWRDLPNDVRTHIAIVS